MITQGGRDYLFEVVGHGFFLRFIANGERGMIIVVDTAEQIEAALRPLAFCSENLAAHSVRWA